MDSLAISDPVQILASLWLDGQYGVLACDFVDALLGPSHGTLEYRQIFTDVAPHRIHGKSISRDHVPVSEKKKPMTRLIRAQDDPNWRRRLKRQQHSQTGVFAPSTELLASCYNSVRLDENSLVVLVSNTVLVPPRMVLLQQSFHDASC